MSLQRNSTSNETLPRDDENGVLDPTSDPAKSSLRTVLWVAAGISTLLCLLVSSLLIRKHLINYTRPREQRKIVAILWIAPIFAVDSFLSLSFQDITPTMDLLKEIYEGYTVYLFFSLLVEYLGGEARAVELIKQRLEPLYRPFPLKLFCSGPLTSDPERFFVGCKRGVIQFVIVRPTMAVISAILFLAGKYTKGDFRLDQGYVYVEFINNASVSWAVYCLVVFYMALKRPLAPHNPLPKFIAIKAVVFLSFWQGIVLSLMARFHLIQDAGSWTTERVTTGVHDLLTCFEMLLAAFYHKHAFPWDVYDRGRTSSITSVGFDENFALSDARRDFAEILPLPKSLLFRSAALAQPTPLSEMIEHDEEDHGPLGSAASTKEPSTTGGATGGGKEKRRDVIMEGEQPLLRGED